MSEGRLAQGLMVFGVLQLITGLGLALVPGTFYDLIANFGVRSDHFLRDYSTYYLVTGVALLMAVGRPTWRVPVLFIVMVQYALHTINHLIDIGDADPSWLGPVDFVALAGLTALLGYLLHVAARSQR